MSYNPNAPAFNPNASSFVPRFQQQAPPQQGGYQQGGYQQGGYPNQQGGYQQGGYQQGGYQQGGYQQGGYPNQQGGYQQQVGYQQGGYQQGGYQQGGYQQGGYPNQRGGYQGGYQQPQAPVQPVAPKAAPEPATQEAAPAPPLGAKAEKRKAGVFVIGKKAPAPPKEDAPKAEEAKAAEEPKAEKKAEAPKEEAKVEKPKVEEKPKKPLKEYKRDPRPHMNVVFCGHVDAGKSTISGQVMYLSGLVDDRTMDKNKRDAQSRNRDGWEFAYLMDLTEDERDRGKTHETGSAYFETEKKRYTILDAPGHKCFVASMIGGASQADVAILVISSRRGEFETGFDHAGQTREHALLLKTCGCKRLVVGINKLDDPSVNWDVERWNEIREKLIPFLKTLGFVENKNTVFIPISGLKGDGIKTRVSKEQCPYYDGPALLEYLDSLEETPRDMEANVRFPIQGRYRDEGKVVIYGKLETGRFVKGDTLLVMPSKREVVIEGAQIGECETELCLPGDFLHVKIRGLEEEDLHAGDVMCLPSQPLKSVWYFQAQIVISDKPIMSSGFQCMMHIHSAETEVNIDKILAKVDKKTNKPIEKEPRFARNGDSIIARIEMLTTPIVAEVYKDFEKMGRFNLREEGKTIAFGAVTKLYETQKTLQSQSEATK